jgi:hypothetical protein
MNRGILRSALLLAGLASTSLFASFAAFGQAIATATGPGTSVSIGGGVSVFQADYGRRVLGGGLVFADLQPHWRFGVEAEARYLRLHTAEQVTETNFLAGPRVLVRSGRWQPYAKFLIGDGRIYMPFGYAHGDFLALVPGAGLDLALSSAISLRVCDFEYQLWRDFPYGDLRPYGVSAGLSVRLNPIRRFPKGSRARH